jgi:hypothetical protein
LHKPCHVDCSYIRLSSCLVPTTVIKLKGQLGTGSFLYLYTNHSSHTAQRACSHQDIPKQPQCLGEQYNKCTVLTAQFNATCVMLLLPLVPPMLLGPLCHKLLSTGHVPRYSADRFWVSCCVCVALLVILESPPASSTSDKLSSLFLVLRSCRKVFHLLKTSERSSHQYFK